MNDVSIALVGLFRKIYNEHKDQGKVYIPNTSVAQVILTEAYKSFINEKIMTPIEQLSMEEKISLTDECRKTGEFFTNETLTERCKALYVIKVINNNS